MFKRICTSKLLLSVVLLLTLATPVFAGDAEEDRLAAIERFTSSPVFTQVFFFLPADQVWGFVDDVDAAHKDFRILIKRLKPIGTFPLFQHLDTKGTVHSLPNILALKQLDTQKMLDWEVAVTRDLKDVVVAVNFRF